MVEAYIHYNFVSKLIVGVGHVQFSSPKFAPEFFCLNFIKRSKNVPLMQQAFGALLVRFSGLLGGESAMPIWGWRPPLAFSLSLSSCLLSVAGESVRLFFCFLFVQHKL